MSQTQFMVHDSTLPGVKVLTRQIRGDERGSLDRIFDLDGLRQLVPATVHQVNRTVTHRVGTVRGLHLQLPPFGEYKLVSCMQGAAFDVAVDLRGQSRTFGHWFGIELSDRNSTSLLLPPGCAHGMQALADNCEMLYVHTAPYETSSEAGLDPRSTELDIAWPMSVRGLSKRDSERGHTLEFFAGVVW